MIITKLQGGLGNQLFQWAATENLSLKLNTNVYYDLSYFKNFPTGGNVSKWKLELNKIGIETPEFLGKFNTNIINDDFHYKEIFDNCYLNGYWQSEKYFIENRNSIRGRLKITEQLKTYILNKYGFLNDNTVSIHVRRGDYLNLQKFHPIQPLEYYENAYDFINNDNINVVVLSNDINWCKNNIKFKNTYYIEGETNIIDMYLMSMCHHNIIANSSFSWWGAWLNNNNDNIVIAPSKWFGHEANLYEGDIIPNNWIRL